MATPTRSPARKKGRTGSSRRSPSMFGIAVGVMVVLGVVAVLLTSLSDRGDDGAGTETAPVQVQGDPLPQFADAQNDPAIGQTAPRLAGSSFDGSGLAITPGEDGPLAILFLAHWCPHCQAEVAALQPWLQADSVPDGVGLVAVSTLADPARANYPPSGWLEREGWEVPTLVDSGEDEAAQAYGLRGTPYWVFLDAQGTVVQRASGELGPDRLSTILQQLAAGT